GRDVHEIALPAAAHLEPVGRHRIGRLEHACALLRSAERTIDQAIHPSGSVLYGVSMRMHVRPVLEREPLAGGIEEPARGKTHVMKEERHARAQNPEPVADTALEADRGRFREILCRTRNLADAEAEMHDLREHLV